MVALRVAGLSSDDRSREVLDVPMRVDSREDRAVDEACTEQRERPVRTLPAARIVFVPFTLVEVDQRVEDERR